MEKKINKRQISSFQISITLLAIGIVFFLIAIFSSSEIIVVGGLGLIFWGALFLLIPPLKHVDADLLITSSLPNYLTIDRILNYLIDKDEAYNIPPCSKEISLPQHLEGLKEMITFIPGRKAEGIAEIEDIARSKFIIENPQGVLISSPGIGLLNKIEQKEKIDFGKTDLDQIDETLPTSFKEYSLAKEIIATKNEDTIIIRINGSLYYDLYNINLKSINLLGCPLVNAAACAIAKSAGKPTLIQKVEVTGKTIIATIKIVDRTFEDRQKLIDDIDKAASRGNDLIKIMNSSITIVDLSFNLLFDLKDKKVNWQSLEEKTEDFGESFVFSGLTIPSLNLAFLNLNSKIKKRSIQETTREIHAIVRNIYDYFDNLKLDNDIKGSIPNLLSTKTIISAYFTLNDLLLGKIAGDKENQKEIQQIQELLLILSNNTLLKVDVDAIKDCINREFSDKNFEDYIAAARSTFKQQFTFLSVDSIGSKKPKS
jgi:hypothetical protein